MNDVDGTHEKDGNENANDHNGQGTACCSASGADKVDRTHGSRSRNGANGASTASSSLASSAVGGTRQI